MSFIRGTEYANKLNSWHNNLEEDRQQRASLRRCSSLLGMFTHPQDSGICYLS